MASVKFFSDSGGVSDSVTAEVQTNRTHTFLQSFINNYITSALNRSLGTSTAMQFPSYQEDAGGTEYNGSISTESIGTENGSGITDSNVLTANDLYSSPVTVFAVLVTFSFLTIFGNGLVIIAVFREHYLKSPPNYFVASLAAADISVGLLLIPFEAITQLLNRSWIFGPIWCELWHSFDVLLSTASILNLCVISLDRYWAICTPMSYPRRMTTKRACKFIALVWILAILISLPAIFWWRSVRTGEVHPETCPFTEDVGYLVSSSCISFYIPLTVMLFAYYKIYKAAIKQSRSIQQGAKLFSSNDKNGTGEMTLRMHRGCPSHEDPPTHRKSFSFGRSDPTGLSLLAQSPCKRAHSMRIHGNRNPEKRVFSEPNNYVTSPANAGTEVSPPEVVDTVIHSVEADGACDHNLQFLPLPLNNNHNRSESIYMSFRRRQSRRSFTVARKLAKFAKEKKAAKTLAIVLGVFIICWLPFFVINIVFAVCKTCAVGHLKLFEVVTWLGWINSAMNPVIYACWSPDLRRAFARLLGCARCIRARQRRKTQRRLSVV